MKITCSQSELGQAISRVSRAISSKVSLPAAQTVLLSAEGSKLKISGTDLSLVMTTTIEAEVEEAGALSVPARLMGDFIRTLPAGDVEMVSSEGPINLNLKCGVFEANIMGLDAKDFPPAPVFKQESVVSLDGETLKQAIRRVAMAASTDEGRLVLTGVNFEIDDGVLTLAASDGFRLAVFKADLEGDVEESVSFVIPARTLGEVQRLLRAETETVELMIGNSGNVLYVRVDDVEIISSLIAGKFPDYRKLVPSAHFCRAVIPVETFRRAGKMSAIFAKEDTGIIRMNLEPASEESEGSLLLVARSGEMGDNEGLLDARVEGEKARIAFNFRYVLDVLEVLDGDVALELSGPSTPGVFKSDGDESYLHVVMPMFVSDW